jgi:hypothetical protein
MDDQHPEPADGSPDGAAAGPPVDDLEPTGVRSVDSAWQRLQDVGEAPLDDHVEIFDDVQRQLHDALAELDDEQ